MIQKRGKNADIFVEISWFYFFYRVKSFINPDVVIHICKLGMNERVKLNEGIVKWAELENFQR